MKTTLKILYLKDPTLTEKQEEEFILKIKYNLRVVSAKEDLIPALEGFVPHILLCSLRTPISSQEVLDILDVEEENIPLIISVGGKDLKKLLPVIEASSANLIRENETPQPDEKRKELEQRHSSAYQNSIDGILISKIDGTIIAANPAACVMLERTEEEICLEGRAGIIDTEDPRLKSTIEERDKFGHAQTELTFVKKSGEKFPVDVTFSVFKDATGDFISINIIRDITKRKLAEDELKISYETYKTIFFHSPIPYWIYDQQTLDIVEVNKMALKKYGYTRKEFLNLSLLDLRTKEELPKLERHFEEAPERGGIRHGKFTHVKKDGSRIKVEVYGYHLKYQGRNCRLVASLDVTEKEAAAAKIELKRARLAATQELAKIGYWEFDVSAQSIFLNDMMYRIWGRDKSTFHATLRSLEETIHQADRERFIRTQKNSIREGKEHDIEYRILRPSGEVRWIHELGRVLTWQDDRPETVERTVQDVTNEKVSLRKLMTSESRYKGIIQSQTNYLIRTDMEGNYTFYNDKFHTDFGWLYEDKEIIGQPSLSSIMEYHHQAVIDLGERCVMSPGTAFQIEIDKPKKKGGIRTTLWDFVCLLDAQGNPDEIQCVGIDISGRVRAEKELKDSELRYQLITEATSDAIWDWDLTSGKLIWGHSFKTMFGHKPEDLETLEAWAALVHPDDLSAVNRELNNAIKGTEKSWYCEYRLKKKSGEYAYVVEQGTFLRDNNLKAYRLVGALEDITEKKKLEDLLKKANALSRIGSFDLDLEKEKLYWSTMTKAIHEVGEDFEPDLDQALYFYKNGTSRNKIKRVLSQAIENREPFDEELEIVTARGKDLWVRVIAQPEVENGKCTRVTGSFQDIDKIKRAELELIEAAEEKETLLESIGDAFFAVDVNWTVTYWNKKAGILLGCPREEILHKNLWEVFDDAIDTPFQHNYQATMNDRKKRQFEAFFDRRSSWYEVSVYPSDEGLSVFFRDVTQRKTAEEKLKELNRSLRAHTLELVTANKGLEQFTYIVSHNLRSPVANIMGLADLLKNEDYPPEIKEQFFTEVFSNIDRLDTMIKDLNNILQVKIDINAQREKIDLRELVSGISSSIQNLIGEEKAEIKCDFEISEIVSVRSYIYSIFYNLILNSIKYRRPDVPPVIEIRTVGSGDTVKLTFKDNGLGIDLSKKEDQVFNLYKRFHHHVEGKGMGLFMVKTQVEMLGGKISLESEVNEGTVFTIIFNENQTPVEIKDETIMSLPGS